MLAVEGLAVSLALAYVILAIFQRRTCWLAGLLSAALYGLIFWNVQLYLQSILQIFYISMSLYGWRAWHQQSEDDPVAIHTKNWRFHLYACLLTAGSSLILGAAMAYWTNAKSPYIDAITTVAALLATWMVAQKLLENWLYWIVINFVSVGLYLSRDLILTAILFVGYLGLAAFGYRTWRHQWQQQTQA